jgi:hypothetical protein
LYTQTGEDYSKLSFKPKEPALGRIERFRISPPPKVVSIKRCIAKAEGSPIYAYAELYEDISAEKAMKDGSIYPSIQDGSAGCTETQPMVLVQPSDGRACSIDLSK